MKVMAKAASKFTFSLFICGLLCMLLSACEMLWILANAPGAKTDIETVLRDNAGVDVQSSNLHMIGTTRRACAEVDLSGEKCAIIVKRLGLKEFRVAETSVQCRRLSTL